MQRSRYHLYIASFRSWALSAPWLMRRPWFCDRRWTERNAQTRRLQFHRPPQGHRCANRPTLPAETFCTRNFPALPAYIVSDKLYHSQKLYTLLTVTHSSPFPVETNVPSMVPFVITLLSPRSDRPYGNVLMNEINHEMTIENISEVKDK